MKREGLAVCIAILFISIIGAGSAWSFKTTDTILGCNWSQGTNINTGDTGGDNVFIGNYAGYSNTSGTNNIFIGGYAGYHTLGGTHNTFVGDWAGDMSTTGSYDTFIGASAGLTNSSGSQNTIIGALAGYNNAAGSYNSYLGMSAGYSNNGGSYNVFLGYFAGYNETTSHKLYIDDCYTGYPCTSPLIYGEFDNRIVKIDGRLEMVAVATPSDVRYKKDIIPLESSLEKVMHLQGVSYEWDKRKVKGTGFESGKQLGLIAQDVEKVLPELVHTDGKGYKTLSYDNLVPVLVEAIKEQQQEIKGQQDALAEKNNRIEKLEKALEKMEQRMALLENPGGTIALK